MKTKRIIASAATLGLILGAASAVADEASIVEVGDSRYIVAQEAWNVDFESQYVGPHRWGAPYVEVKDSFTSSTLTNSFGNSLTAHAGSAANSITSEDTGDDEHGLAMKLAANDNAQVQLNEFAASATGDVLVYEWDYKLTSMPENASASILVMQPITNPDSWLTSLKITPSATMPQFSIGTAVRPVNLYQWYSITCYVNFIDRTISYYIDGEFFYSGAIAAAAQNKGKKVVSMLANAKGGVCWIDNFKHYSLNAIPEITGIATGEDYIDIEASKAIPITEFSKDDIISNITVKYKDSIIELVDVEATDSDKVIRFKTAQPIPTAVLLNINIVYSGIEISGSFESSPAPIDIKNVTVSQNGSTFTAKATGYNELGSEHMIVMIMALYDANGAVVGMSYGIPSPIFTDIDMVVCASSDKAVSAKVFFMEDWTSSKPFKNIYYLSE